MATVVALLRAQPNERGWHAPCPAHAHPGQSPTSLLIFPGDHTEVGLACSAGCTPEDIRSTEVLREVFAGSPPDDPDTRTSDEPVPAFDVVLTTVEDFIKRYVVLTDAQAIAATLFVAHTWAIDAAETSPYLAVTSPEKRSGKTRLLEVLELLVRSPIRAANVSDAALFRLLAEKPRTLLFDEVDAIFNAKGTVRICARC